MSDVYSKRFVSVCLSADSGKKLVLFQIQSILFCTSGINVMYTILKLVSLPFISYKICPYPLTFHLKNKLKQKTLFEAYMIQARSRPHLTLFALWLVDSPVTWYERFFQMCKNMLLLKVKCTLYLYNFKWCDHVTDSECVHVQGNVYTSSLSEAV